VGAIDALRNEQQAKPANKQARRKTPSNIRPGSQRSEPRKLQRDRQHQFTVNFRRFCVLDPHNARVTATNGEMSTLEFLRDHAHASPSGRFTPPSIAAESSGVPR
jgi:hypothetical protein